MRPERARELYSDYAEGVLSPALRLAMDQHFEADPSARDEMQAFSRAYRLLETTEWEIVDVPVGFRAKVLEQIGAEQARRANSPAQRASLTLTGWFRTVGRRRATGGVLAALAGCVVLGIVLTPRSNTGTNESNFGPQFNLKGAVPTTLEGVLTTEDANGTHFNVQIHLPTDVPSAMVSAYILTNNSQITQPNLLAQATPALSPALDINNAETVTIPVSYMRSTPPGTTMNMLVQWTPTGTQSVDSQVVFTPSQPGMPASNPQPLPASSNFFDALQSIAADDGVTVIADSDSAPTQGITVSPGNSPASAMADLQQVAGEVGASVQLLPSGAYLVSLPSEQLR